MREEVRTGRASFQTLEMMDHQVVRQSLKDSLAIRVMRPIGLLGPVS
jgi:hypothetical protein